MAFYDDLSPSRKIKNTFARRAAAKRLGDKTNRLLAIASKNKLIEEIGKDTAVDTQSKNEFLAALQNSKDAPTELSNFGRIRNEFRKAVEGIDPKYRSRKNVEEYYKAVVDKPGSRQTRSPDLLMSNAFTGVIGR